ncbi:hypothetical protein VNI00_008074 [Paramarasmius palmivorus]|uniref:ABM domain-containing protein n=1 Tax=Paramarasmius palmivorus TaxID=297713 RepID=A0AAW0CV30_9AGAR
MPLIEIAWFKSTQTYQNDHSLTAETAKRLIQLDGLHEIYFGFKHEDPTIAYVLNVWESYEHLEAANKHESFMDIFSTFQPAVEGTLQDITVITSDVPSLPKLKETLSAGITEIALAELQKGSEDLVPNLLEAIDAAEPMAGPSWGAVRGKAGEYVLIVGWASVEAHYESFKTGKVPEVAKWGAKTISNMRPSHVKFWKAA